MNSYEEIKKLVESSRKIFSNINESTKNDIRSKYRILTEQPVEDKKEVENNKKSNEEEISETKKSINIGRISLFCIGGLYVLIGFIEAYYIEYHHIIFGIIDWFFALIFLGLAIWSYAKPYLALIIGLVLFILLNLLVAIIDPATIFSGIILKFAFIAWLIHGIKNANLKK